MADKTALKIQRLEECVNRLRHVVRHNGAAISPNAGIAEVAEHVLDMNPDRVKTLWTDINTIDRVKCILHSGHWTKRPALTTEELLEYGVNDERLVADQLSWAVVRITKTGTEILTYGGNYYQTYKPVTTSEEVTEEVLNEETGETETVTNTVEKTEFVQQGDTELLLAQLNSEDAAWMAEIWEADIHGNPIYKESGVEYIQIPCELPGDLGQLISISITRTKIKDGTPAAQLEYSLTEQSCDTSNAGMVELPHGLWLIYDNSNLQSAPQALLIPKALALGTETGLRMDHVRIAYSSLVSGLARLRLVGDSFGDAYIVSTQDFEVRLEGTWKE